MKLSVIDCYCIDLHIIIIHYLSSASPMKWPKVSLATFFIKVRNDSSLKPTLYWAHAAMLPGKAQACAAVSAQVLRLAHFHLILLLQVEERCVNNVALSCLRRLTSGVSVALVICTDCSCMFMRFLLLVAVPAAVMNREQHGTAWNSSRQRRSSQPCSLRWSSLSSAAPFRQGSLQERRRWHPAACRFVPWLPETELRPHEIDSLRTLHAKWLWEWIGWHVLWPFCILLDFISVYPATPMRRW